MKQGGMQFKGGTYKGQVIIDASQAISSAQELDRVLTKVGSTFSHMAKGINISDLWNEQAASIENVSKALDEFNRSQNSVGSAEGLMKALNAFSAWHPEKDINSIFSELGSGADELIAKAKSLAVNLDSAFSVQSLRESFKALDVLKTAGVDLETIFTKLNQGDLSELSEEVNALQRSLRRTNEEAQYLREELSKYESGEAIEEMQERIAKLENGIYMAKNEFRSFLQTAGFSGWELDDTGRFEEFFESIADGTMTANQAIASFKQQYSYMFSDLGSNELNAILSQLSNICTELEQMRNAITQLGATGSLGEMRQYCEDGAEAAREQSAALQQMSVNAAALDSLIGALTRLATASEESGENAGEAKNAVSQLIDSVSKLGQTDIASLERLSEILKSLAKMDGLTVGKASVQNLVGAFESLSRIPSTASLIGLSNVDFRNFNDLHISKASLNNLATYLPEISKSNVDALKSIASISWDSLNNLNINKASVNSLKDLVSSMNGQPLSIESAKISIDEGSLSKLAGSIEDAIQKAAQNIKITIHHADLSASAKEEIAKSAEEAAMSTKTATGNTGSGINKQVDNETAAIERNTEAVKKNASASASASKQKADAVAEFNRAVAEMEAGTTSTIDAEVSEEDQVKRLINLYKEYGTALVNYEKARYGGVDKNADLYAKKVVDIQSEIAALEDLNGSLQENEDVIKAHTAALEKWQVVRNKNEARDINKSVEREAKEARTLNEVYEKEIDLAYRVTEAENKRAEALANSAANRYYEKRDAEAAAEERAAEATERATRREIDSWNEREDALDRVAEANARAVKSMSERNVEAEVDATYRAVAAENEYAEARERSINATFNQDEERIAEEKKREAEQIRKATNEYYAYEEAALKAAKARADLYEGKVNRNDIGSSTSGIKFSGDETAMSTYKAAVDEARRAIEELRSATTQELETALDAAGRKVNALLELKGQLNSAAQAQIDLQNAQNRANNLADKVDVFLSKNGKLAAETKAELQEWVTQLRTGEAAATGSVGEIENRFKALQAQIKVTGQGGKTFFQQMKAGLQKFGGWSIVSRSFMKIISTFKQMVTAVKEVDAAMTELRKVTDLTEAGYMNLYESMTNMATKVGAKLSDTINSVADFARLGYTASEALDLSEAALTYFNVGDALENIGEATESIISTMKAFNVEASDAMSIVDKFNEVGKELLPIPVATRCLAECYIGQSSIALCA